ncbi:Os07g0446400, partial [Oryza sativa Japonica Group]
WTVEAVLPSLLSLETSSRQPPCRNLPDKLVQARSRLMPSCGGALAYTSWPCQRA